jgi:hypothetical protein
VRGLSELGVFRGNFPLTHSSATPARDRGLPSKVELLARLLVRDNGSHDEYQAIALAASMTVRQHRAKLADRPHDISTTKIFREHVDAAELHARVQGLALGTLEPPSFERLEDARDLERHVLPLVLSQSGDAERVGQPEPGPTSVPIESSPEEPDLGTVSVLLSLPEDLATFWTQREWLGETRLDVKGPPGPPSSPAEATASRGRPHPTAAVGSRVIVSMRRGTASRASALP